MNEEQKKAMKAFARAARILNELPEEYRNRVLGALRIIYEPSPEPTKEKP